jgi:ribonuclease-3
MPSTLVEGVVTAGDLTKFKAFLVKNNNISEIAGKLNLDNYLLKGKSEVNNKSGKEKRLADVFEAIIGAIFYDQGYDKTEEIVLKHCSKDIQAFLSLGPDDLKATIDEKDQTSKFNNQYQKLYKVDPFYEEEQLSTNPPYYSCKIIINNFSVTGFGTNKKLAKKDACKKGLKFLQ